jgi:hypothetical protein
MDEQGCRVMAAFLLLSMSRVNATMNASFLTP